MFVIEGSDAIRIAPRANPAGQLQFVDGRVHVQPQQVEFDGLVEHGQLPALGLGPLLFQQRHEGSRRGGDVVAQVTAWLDEEAAKPEWQAQVEASRQSELF